MIFCGTVISGDVVSSSGTLTTVSVNVSSSVSTGVPSSVTVTVMSNNPASSDPGAQNTLPVPTSLSVSTQNDGRSLVENVRESPSGSVAVRPILSVSPSSTC